MSARSRRLLVLTVSYWPVALILLILGTTIGDCFEPGEVCRAGRQSAFAMVLGAELAIYLLLAWCSIRLSERGYRAAVLLFLAMIVGGWATLVLRQQ